MPPRGDGPDVTPLGSVEGPAHEGRLARALATLGNETRLAILEQLRAARTLREIEVRGSAGTMAHERTLSRQTVREHLDRLLEIGVVHAREAERDYGPTVEYSLNHQMLFALGEEFRALARMSPLEEPAAATVRRPADSPTFGIEGPCLVLVKGIDEGRTFALAPQKGRARWTIGRSRGLDVALDFDPYVSSENAEISWEDGTHFLRDLPESRNGTLLNFQPLPRTGRRALRTGDLIGVGRSILMFRS